MLWIRQFFKYEAGKILTRLLNDTRIRDNYEEILLLNFDFALSKDIEQNLWKTAFYKVIEEYRKRLRKVRSSAII